MGGYNLPPGCNVSDIPGNRPGEDAAEAFENALCSRFVDVEKLLESTSGVDQLTYNLFVKVADWAFRKGVDDGYTDGQADRAINDEVEGATVEHEKQELMMKMAGNLEILKSINDILWDEEIKGDTKIPVKQTLRQQKQALDNLAGLVENLSEL